MLFFGSIVGSDEGLVALEDTRVSVFRLAALRLFLFFGLLIAFETANLR